MLLLSSVVRVCCKRGKGEAVQQKNQGGKGEAVRQKNLKYWLLGAATTAAQK